MMPGLSARSGSLPRLWTTSIRNPSIPRSSQNRMTSCAASTTLGLSQFKSACSRRNECKYQAPVIGWRLHADPTAGKHDCQLFGGGSPGLSTHTYQSRLALVVDDADSTNHGWSVDVWFGTQSSRIRMSRSWAASISRSTPARSPNTGLMS